MITNGEHIKHAKIISKPCEEEKHLYLYFNSVA